LFKSNINKNYLVQKSFCGGNHGDVKVQQVATRSRRRSLEKIKLCKNFWLWQLTTNILLGINHLQDIDDS